MIDARHFAGRIEPFVAALALAAISASLASAQDQWHAAGTSHYANSGSQNVSTPNTTGASSSDPAWKLPNQSNTGDTQLVDEDSNPLRQTGNSQPGNTPREPRSFTPPSNAKPMSAQQPGGPNNPAATARRTSQVQNQQYVEPRNAPYRQPGAMQGMQGTAPQSFASPTSYNQPANPNRGGKSLIRAHQVQSTTTKPAPTTQKQAVSENLPAPGDDVGATEYPDPTFRYPSGPGAGFHSPFGGPYYQPYGPNGGCENGSCPCGPNGGCDNCCETCGPDCGCPCGAECEPGCGCATGDCQKECLCIGPGDDESCHVVKVRWPKWQEVMVFGEAQGFKGPFDRERDSGNFGFNEGFNIGAKVPYALLGYQYGYRAAESQLNGDKDTGIDKSFLQSFVTAGLFHRQKEGLNFGVVWDALIDERLHTQNFHQVRSECSIINGCHEFGFDATVGLNKKSFEDPNDATVDLTYQASDQYLLFYRLHGCNGGEGRVFGGVNNDSDAIIGSDMLLPLTDCFSVQGGFTYLIPNAKNGTEGATQEAWNIGIGLVWHWDHQAHKCFDNCYRPMFNVADNGSLIIDQQGKNN
jgi:hypothetical protein